MRTHRWLSFGLLVFVVIAIVLYIWGALRQGFLVNTDMGRTDQSAYMDYAKNMAVTQLQFVGDRNRMPLYPGLMALFYRPGMSDQAFFAIGKIVGIGIGAIVLIGTFLLFKHFGKTVDAVVATLVTMLTVFAYKAPYFQCEILFYGLTLLLFVLVLRLLQRPHPLTAVLVGSVGAFAHLTKASILPTIVLATGLLLIRGIYEQGRSWRFKPELPHDRGEAAQLQDTPLKMLPPQATWRTQVKSTWQSIRTLRLHIVCISLVLVCFLGILSPYLQTSKRIFGHYFYNVNSTFYMWYNSWEEAEQGTKAHGDRVGWPKMPPEEIPSLQKYLREHTPGQILHRFSRGFDRMLERTFTVYWYAQFILAYLLALGVLLGQNWHIWRSQIFPRIHPCTVLFVIGYFTGYLALYAWYSPIASGNRFSLALFLPMLFLIVRGLAVAQAHNLSIRIGGKPLPAAMISPVILLLLVVYAITVYPSTISTFYAGR